MTSTSLARLSDHELLAETQRVVDADRRTTAELLTLLGEIDTRRLFRDEGHPSMFSYCTHVLHFTEAETYSRITAARVARGFPLILRRLADGDINLTTVTLLSGHLTDDNHEQVLDAARHLTKPQVEKLVAAIDPKPDIRSSVRKLPTPGPTEPTASTGALLSQAESPEPAEPAVALTVPVAHQRAAIAPLAPERYLVKFTIGQETRDKLERARDLLRHVIPDGDPAAIVDRALTVLISELERTKLAAIRRPRSNGATSSSSRHVPAAVKRAVWSRDEGRCAFVGSQGRCPETGFLEFHHVVPFAEGGATTADNLQLRCRSHNALEAERHFGREVMSRALATSKSRRHRTLSRQSLPRLWS
jgi:5-methylcytosine-specific restriction endonuclease McrA